MANNYRFRKSLELYEDAQSTFPYGTQLFSRRPELGPFGQVSIYFEKAKHGHFWDVDGNKFIDTVMAFGPISLGYCYDLVDHAIKRPIDKGILHPAFRIYLTKLGAYNEFWQVPAF